jgi:nucleotide-binding universal stress UspA family protein
MNEDLFRVLLPLKPKGNAGDVLRLMRAILPPHRTIVRRLYVHAPVHTGPVFPGAPYEGLASVELDAQNATQSETMREMQEFGAAGFQVECDVRRGSPREAIVQEAGVWPADLVAIRTRDEAAGDHRIGRVASALLSHAPCMVLTYRDVPESYRVRRILLPIDFSAASRQGVEWGGAIAEITGAEQRLVHVQTPGAGPPLVSPGEVSRMEEAELEQWRARVDLVLTRPVARAVVLEAESAAEGILAAAKQERCDLIVLASTGASLLHDMLLGSTARQVVRKSPSPVLVVPKGNRVTVTGFLQKVWRLEQEEAGSGMLANGPADGRRASLSPD